ncbi:MAG: NAD(P)H-binding protein [Alteromonadaceae bacterium]|nr:NAD(P)H-binding protein [Alteromonadaceae bacterium]
MPNTIQHLIIGASGKTGSRIHAKLTKLGFQPKAASRDGEVKFDWNDPTTWSQALTGIDSVYLTYFPDLAIAKAPEDISRFCALAKIKGVNHITLLSGRGEPAAQVCENIVKQSGMSWTIVRASWFNQNFSEGLFKHFIMGGHIALPVNAVTEPFIDIDDIADVACASLIEPGHSGQLYEVTGPELLSFAELASRFSRILGRKIDFTQITLEDFKQKLAKDQIDIGIIEALSYLFTEVLDGRNEYLTDGVKRALGRMPKSFDQYIVDNAHHFTEGK